jgi:hypothetical protein
MFIVTEKTYNECQSQLNINKTYDDWYFEEEQRPTRDRLDILNVQRDLDEVGYSIINCVSHPEKIYNKVIEDYIEYQMLSDDCVSDIRELLPNKFLKTHSGIVPYSENFTHSEALWTIRSHPEIVEFIAQLYNCSPKDLAVSYDTMGIRYAPEILNMITNNVNISFYDIIVDDELSSHVDQAFEREYHEHYQGIYCITDSKKDDDGGLYVYPSTHKLHGMKLQELLETPKNRDYIQYPEKFSKLFKNSYPIKLNVNAGNIILWDSRLLHGSVPIYSLRNYDLNNYDIFSAFKLNRMVSYICYARKTDVNNFAMSTEEIYYNGYGTNHMIKRPRIISHHTIPPEYFINEYHKSLISLNR